MKITIIGRQMNVYEEMKKLIERKLGSLDKYFSDEATATVTLQCRPHAKRVELTVNASGTLFRGESDGASFRDALDDVISAIDRQIRKNKTKLQRRIRDNTLKFPEFDFMDEVEEDNDEVVKVKTYSLRPMSTEDAILEMNLLGHEFYVFLMDEAGTTGVVYKRKEGGYGLIIPEQK